MGKRVTNNFGRGKKAAVCLLLLVCVSAAIFGVYKVANAVLGNILPNYENIASFAQSSSAVSSNPSVKSTADTSGSSASSQIAVNGVFSAYSETAQKKLDKMTLKEKVGQIFIFVCPNSGQIKAIDDYRPCGYCLMAKDFENKIAAQVKKTLNSYQNSSKIKMVLCCDEEGGTVVRLSKYSALSGKKFQSPQQVYKSGGMTGITNDTAEKAKLLKSFGINMNLAPVCDVSTDSSDFIYARSFGKNAAETAEFITASVNAYNNENLSCVLKHFPGYGNNADTHTGIAYDKRGYQTFQESDFLPFKAGIEAQAPCVMVSHNIVQCMDSQHPASLSPQVHNILREKLGFTGVIMTDDLSMKAITQFTGGKSACVAAFEAGNDVLLTNGNISADFNALYSAVKDGTISEARLNESVLRVLAWKCKMGIIS